MCSKAWIDGRKRGLDVQACHVSGIGSHLECLSLCLRVSHLSMVHDAVLGRDPKALSWLFVSERHRRKGLYTLKILKAGQVCILVHYKTSRVFGDWG